MQSSSQIVTTNKPTLSFLQAICPSCRPTNSNKALTTKTLRRANLQSNHCHQHTNTQSFIIP